MPVFSKAHKDKIVKIRDTIDENPKFRKMYQINANLHHFIEWYCNTPGLEDPIGVFTTGLLVAQGYKTEKLQRDQNGGIDWLRTVNTINEGYSQIKQVEYGD